MSGKTRTKKKVRQRSTVTQERRACRYALIPFPHTPDPLPRHKYFDINVSGSMLATVSYNLLSSIPQGSAQSQRVGDTLWIKGVSFRYEIATANSDIFNLVRVIIFSWIPNTSSITPGSTSILESPLTQVVQSFYNYEGRQDFCVFYDSIMAMTGTASAPTIGSLRHVEQHIAFSGKGYELQYNPGATTGTRQIYTLVMSDSAVSPNPAIDLWARLYYTDL